MDQKKMICRLAAMISDIRRSLEDDRLPQPVSRENGDETGHVVDALNALIDAIRTGKSEHDETAGRLRNVRDRLARLEANIPGMVYVYRYTPADPANPHCFLWTNDYCEKLFGIPPEDLMRDGSLLADLIHPEDRERRDASIERSLETMTPWRQELRHVVNGEVRWHDCISRPTRTAEGDVIWDGIILDITEQKKTEEKLRESDRFLFNIFEQNPYPVWISDDRGTLISINRACCELLDVKPDELVGKYNVLEDNIVAEQGYLPLVRSVYEEGKLVRFILEYDKNRLLHPRLSEPLKIVLDVTIAPVKDEQDRVTHAVIIHQDITDHWQAEDELLRNEEKYRSVVDNIGLGVVLIGPDMEILSGNRQIREWFPEVDFGTKPTCYKAFNDPPRQKPCAYCACIKTFRDGRIHETITETPVAGGIKNYRIVSSPIKGESGKVEGVVEIVEDITVRQNTLQALQESEDRFSKVLDGLDALVYVADMDTYELLFVNRYGRRKWGDIIGKICWQTLQADQNGPCPFCTNDKLIGPDNQPAGVCIWELKNTVTGEWFECRDQAIRWTDGRLVRMEIATNISQRKGMEDEKDRLDNQLRQAQKMEAIGTLAGGIAHDFNNILVPILGYAEIAKEQVPVESSLRDDLEQIVLSAQRAKELVRQILDFSRQRETERILIQPAHIIKEVVKLLRSTIPTTIRIEQNIDSRTKLVMADPTQLNQIVMNLCTNAFHAMEETGGTLTICFKEVEIADEDIASNPDATPGTFVQLTVKDTGKGILPEVRERIFEPYFTTKETSKGTGMGLAILHGIVKSYGGYITMESQIGRGSAFHVFLPVMEEARSAEKKTDAPLLLGNERILFVDDEKPLTEIGVRILSSLGYHVTATMNPLEALRMFQDRPDAFDLVITDQTMPEMTGSTLARSMLRIRPDIPIILCTGYSSTISAEKTRKLGIREFALKPLVKKEIAKLVRKVLDEE